MIYRCSQGCEVDVGMSKGHPGQCSHGETLVYDKRLKRNPMNRTIGPKTKRRSLKKGRGFQASKVQQKKVRGLACIYCGRDPMVVQIDPAHVYPRGRVSCECKDGVIPLCRLHHEQYDRDEIDLLPLLITQNLRVEMVHHVLVHDVSMIRQLEYLTGCKVMFE